MREEPDRYRAGSGPPLVLLHGLGATWRVWRPVLGALTRHHDVLALTLPGHLGAPPLSENTPVTADTLVERIEAELEREGIRAAHVAGNSLGGWLALELARRGRALSVVAVSPIGLLTPDEIDRLTRRLRASHAVASNLGRLARGLASFGLGRRLLFGDVRHRPASLTAAEAREWFDAFVGCSGFGAMVDALAANSVASLPANLDCPICIAWPTEDRMTPERPFADRFAAALPRAIRARVPASGHIPMGDAPERIAEVILEHARRSSGAAAEH